MELIKLLVPNTESVSLQKPNCCITVCGDRDQSIYGFLNGGEHPHKVAGCGRKRGTNNFDEFLTHFRGANIVKLQRNYRSTGNLVRAAGTLIAKNGANETSCACETPNKDGQKIVLINSSSEEREVQVCRMQVCTYHGIICSFLLCRQFAMQL
jgi:superfamily I DNA/RNA helicase